MKRVVALGFFDGVHIGHGELLKRTEAVARGMGEVSCVLTFDRHPEEFITGKKCPLLGTMRDRKKLIREKFGIDEVFFARFDRTFMSLEWDDFINEILIKELSACHVVAGHDYHFGFKGLGNPDKLREFCEASSLGCDIIQKVELDGITVSSTYIRKLVSKGDMDGAGRFLGRPYAISGFARHGRGLGSSLGAPTVNMSIADGLQHPAFGVYASRLKAGGETFRAVTNIGVRPTVSADGAVWVESNIFDFSGDIYGKKVSVELLRFLRPEQAFLTLDMLKGQIRKDIGEAKKYHSEACVKSAK